MKTNCIVCKNEHEIEKQTITIRVKGYNPATINLSCFENFFCEPDIKKRLFLGRCICQIDHSKKDYLVDTEVSFIRSFPGMTVADYSYTQCLKNYLTEFAWNGFVELLSKASIYISGWQNYSPTTIRLSSSTNSALITYIDYI